MLAVADIVVLAIELSDAHKAGNLYETRAIEQENKPDFAPQDGVNNSFLGVDESVPPYLSQGGPGIVTEVLRDSAAIVPVIVDSSCAD